MGRRAGPAVLFAGLVHSGHGYETLPSSFEDPQKPRMAVVDPITSTVYVDAASGRWASRFGGTGGAIQRSSNMPAFRWWARAVAAGALCDVLVIRAMFGRLRGRLQRRQVRTAKPGTTKATAGAAAEEAPAPAPGPQPPQSPSPGGPRRATLLAAAAGLVVSATLLPA